MNTELKNKAKEVLKSKTFKKIVCGLGIFAAAGFIFQAGVLAGFHRASFGRNWGENYSRNFGPMRHNVFMFNDNLPNAHGAIGKILKVELPTIIVLDKDMTEKVVRINDDTNIRLIHEDVSKDKLIIGDTVVIIGSPNSSGQIEAKLIRILPAPLDDGNAFFTIPVNPPKK